MKSFFLKRNINGIILLDKPSGFSSNAVLQIVKKMFNANKAGHTGSLDPLASGILPICLGKATKIAEYLIQSDKSYSVILKLGQKTSTLDSEGYIIKERTVTYNLLKNINMILQKFIGEVYQIPPIYSAVKYQGIPLYKYARNNITPPQKIRKIFIKEIILVNQYKNYVTLKISCSKGTYIRSLIDDIGDMLGCCAHVVFLRRISFSKYTLNHTVTLRKLEIISQQNRDNTVKKYKFLDSLLLSIDHPLSYLTEYVINISQSIIFKNGIKIKTINVKHIGIVKVINNTTKSFIGIGNIKEDGYLYPKKIIY
ncbi:tRNA pseudouridine synthase B [Buchnera aphidicola (Thelaxes suberi)]|uniref:tRNA pseudouridine(55) synthase TruB n=1 Tax=Buchnera aphidicola TaxID=9 RepID=UPI003463850E